MVGVGVALGGLEVAGVNPIAIRELNLILASARARHLHVVAELILKRKRAGLGVALLSVLLNGGTGRGALLVSSKMSSNMVFSSSASAAVL